MKAQLTSRRLPNTEANSYLVQAGLSFIGIRQSEVGFFEKALGSRQGMAGRPNANEIFRQMGRREEIKTGQLLETTDPLWSTAHPNCWEGG